MSSKSVAFMLLCSLAVLVQSCTREEPEQSASGPYFGLKPPGRTAELFAPGILSTAMYELNAVFFPGGREVIYSVSTGPMRWALVMVREVQGEWTAPEVAPFSGAYGGVDPCVTPDGRRVYFCSNRPRDGGVGEPEQDYDIWYVDRAGAGWSEPVNIGPPVNSSADEFYPSLTTDGTLYFQSRREGGFGSSDIYRAKFDGGAYREAELLPEPINSPGPEGDAFVAPDGSYIIVSTRREEQNFGAADLYISFSRGDGSWSPLVNMGGAVNSAGSENCQTLSPCGKHLFFTSRRFGARFDAEPFTYRDIYEAWMGPQNGGGDAYWIDAAIIEEMRGGPRGG